eukprot:361334-Chlamydomonas_euryale.AAC.4
MRKQICLRADVATRPPQRPAGGGPHFAVYKAKLDPDRHSGLTHIDTLTAERGKLKADIQAWITLQLGKKGAAPDTDSGLDLSNT